MRVRSQETRPSNLLAEQQPDNEDRTESTTLVRVPISHSHNEKLALSVGAYKMFFLCRRNKRKHLNHCGSGVRGLRRHKKLHFV